MTVVRNRPGLAAGRHRPPRETREKEKGHHLVEGDGPWLKPGMMPDGYITFANR